jgi:hypothetical protein
MEVINVKLVVIDTTEYANDKVSYIRFSEEIADPESVPYYLIQFGWLPFVSIVTDLERWFKATPLATDTFHVVGSTALAGLTFNIPRHRICKDPVTAGEMNLARRAIEEFNSKL